jgi:hypothetical protein
MEIVSNEIFLLDFPFQRNRGPVMFLEILPKSAMKSVTAYFEKDSI